jgi:hypothetical protein
VRAAGGWLVDFCDIWCQIVVEVGCIGYAVVGGRECGNLTGVCCSLKEVAWECCNSAEVAEGGWCWGVVAHDSTAGPIVALVGGGCQ